MIDLLRDAQAAKHEWLLVRLPPQVLLSSLTKHLLMGTGSIIRGMAVCIANHVSPTSLAKFEPLLRVKNVLISIP